MFYLLQSHTKGEVTANKASTLFKLFSNFIIIIITIIINILFNFIIIISVIFIIVIIIIIVITTISWIRAKVSFAILRSALLCLTGTRTKRRAANISDIDITSESAQARI